VKRKSARQGRSRGRIELFGLLAEEQYADLLRIADRCRVYRTPK